MDQKSIKRQCQQKMKVGSLSFTFAARLLGGRSRDLIFFLYAWCRHCDDVIDNLPAETPPAAKLETLRKLEETTRRSLQYRCPNDGPVFAGMHLLNQRTNIPSYYPRELLRGMEMDIVGYRYQTFEDLRLYCYRVAGVVGLMTCHIFGLKDDRALAYAEAMGEAMQLTNIARDILEDANMGRVYLPEEWLTEVGLTRETLALVEHRPQLAQLARRLVERAEDLYREGEKGLTYLPWRPALAVATARFVYGEIGHFVVQRGAKAWDSRTWVPGHRKLVQFGKAAWLIIKSVPARVCHPVHPQPILRVRKHP